MIETAKIVQAVCFLLGYTGRADKLKLVKLLYLADKCHLIRYGRTVTGDEYWAMDYGPVGSTVKDIFGFDEEFLSREFQYASTMLKRIGKYQFEASASCSTGELDLLSETDIEALRIVVEEFGHMSTGDLIRYTPRYPEWAQYEKLFSAQQIKREKIRTEKLLSSLPDDPFNVPPEHMEESRRIITGLAE